jgi:hypothetical protein
MDEKVHQMVAKNIQSSKIIIQGKGKIGEKANTIRLISKVNQPLDMIPGENSDLDIYILDNIAQVIKVERGREGIGVDEESDPGDQPDGHEMSKKRSVVSFLWRCVSLLGKRWMFLRLGHNILFLSFFP